MGFTPLSSDLRAPFERPAALFAARRAPTRGIRWVLQWSAALGVLLVAGCHLASFAYCLAAEHALARAARAAALEATLPRATSHSVEQCARRRLPEFAAPSTCLRLNVDKNGAPVRGALQPAGGDTLSITLAIPADAAIPRWLNTLRLVRRNPPIVASASRTIPGRTLMPPCWMEDPVRR